MGQYIYVFYTIVFYELEHLSSLPKYELGLKYETGGYQLTQLSSEIHSLETQKKLGE